MISVGEFNVYRLLLDPEGIIWRGPAPGIAGGMDVVFAVFILLRRIDYNQRKKRRFKTNLSFTMMIIT